MMGLLASLEARRADGALTRGSLGTSRGSTNHADAAVRAEGAPSTVGPLVRHADARVAHDNAVGSSGHENDGAGIVIDAGSEEEPPAHRGLEASRRKRRKVGAEGAAPTPPPLAGRGRGAASSGRA